MANAGCPDVANQSDCDEIPVGRAIIDRADRFHVHDIAAEPNESSRSRHALRHSDDPCHAVAARRCSDRCHCNSANWMCALSPRSRSTWSKTFADQAVIAIENVRLFKELEERTNELTRSVGELRALGEVGQAVSSTLDLETVLTRIASHAVQLSGTDGGAIYEYDEATQEFH